jgi:hypothetical protein
MADLSLQERLVRYFQNHPHQPIAKGTLCDLAREKMGVTGETVGRRLRVLAEVSNPETPDDLTKTDEHEQAVKLLDGGKITVTYDGPHTHAYYTYTPPTERKVWKVRFEGDRAIQYYETIKTTP